MIEINKDSIVMTCGGCPSQWDAETTDGEYVFIRVRHGYFSLEVSGELIFDGNPDGVDGVMNTDDMIDYVNGSEDSGVVII